MQMRTQLVCAGLVIGSILVAGAVGMGAGAGAGKAEPKLAHMVFFTLKDRSEAAREKLAASCLKYLGGHEGTLHFSVGTIAEDVVEPVSDREFDVALHLVFENKEANQKYQKSERHVKFVSENRESFAKVRVFDTYLKNPNP
jgi:hypothetical protein